jgi:enoyl-CoA hydratase/carnithine racemase
MDGMIDSGTSRMIAKIDGPVGWMVFNNPARRNAVSLDMWEAVPRILAHFEADPAIRVIALAGEGGRAFVSGADISQFEQQRSNVEQIAHYDSISAAASSALKHVSKPTVAVIRGWCIGGGLGIAATCDLRFATDASRFGVPAGRLGLGYAHPGVKTLMDIVGPAYTKEIFYTARHFTAAEAERMGFVNRVLPEAEFETFVAGQLALIAANAPLTLRALKTTVGELLRGADADIARCQAVVAECFASDDYKEGRRAFMEKRQPSFQGR